MSEHPAYEIISQCSICGNRELKEILSLGNLPLANSLLSADQLRHPDPSYPLDVVFCPTCSLVQLSATVSPEVLFRQYLYFSSFSDAMLAHARGLARKLIQSHDLGENSLVVEVASNDGYLLQYFVEAGVPVLGIEPARNIAQVAEERGVRTLPEFFGLDLAETLQAQGHAADAIIGLNVLAHVSDLHGFADGIHALLKEDGVAVIEVPYVKTMIDRCEFDTIYHEHRFYYSLTALDRLFEAHRLRLADVELLDIHGGSLRLYVQHRQAVGQREAVEKFLAQEAHSGIRSYDYYKEFADKVDGLRLTLQDVLHGLKARDRRLAAYGAAAKGSILLNTIGVGTDVLDFVVDRSRYKQGHYMPGSHLPIHPPERLLQEMPDYVLLLAWNFADEILKQQAEYRRRGGRFIVGIPHVKIL